MTTSIPLRKKISAHGDDAVETLEMREVVGKDLRTIGIPYSAEIRPDGSQLLHFDGTVIGRLIAACCNIPVSSVDKMGAADFQAAMTELLLSFGDTLPRSSAKGISTTADGGGTSDTSLS